MATTTRGVRTTLSRLDEAQPGGGSEGSAGADRSGRSALRRQPQSPQDRIIVAVDVPTAAQALSLARRLTPVVGALKVGLELFNAAGPSILAELQRDGSRVFYDAKLHDIPNTVKGAVGTIGAHGVWMLNVHATGGRAMMRAAAEAASELAHPPLMIAVTLLTSLEAADLEGMYAHAIDVAASARRLAVLARDAGLDGVVCSPLEAAAIREACGDDFLIVTPGVRPASAAVGDQKRVATPAQAVAHGADYLVIGRPITGADDPVAAARAIAEELS